MKALKLKMYQETACYKKPFAFKVTETYPLPPYSTIIGMIHKVIKAESGEYVPMDISIQGSYEGIVNSYNTTRFFKSNEVTSMPLNVHMLLGVNLIIHIYAEEEIMDRIIDGFKETGECFSLGRREDLVRLDSIKKVFVEEIKYNRKLRNSFLLKENCYIPKKYNYNISGINYRLNKRYRIQNNLRVWEKISSFFVEKDVDISSGTYLIDDDNEGSDIIFFA